MCMNYLHLFNCLLHIFYKICNLMFRSRARVSISLCKELRIFLLNSSLRTRHSLASYWRIMSLYAEHGSRELGISCNSGLIICFQYIISPYALFYAILYFFCLVVELATFFTIYIFLIMEGVPALWAGLIPTGPGGAG